MLNFFKVLGVGPRATRAQIKAAYRRLALEHHPDTNSQSAEHARDATDRFRKIADAYKTLSDPTLRAEYILELRLYCEEVNCHLCEGCGTLNRLTRRLPQGKEFVCGVCGETLPVSEAERERHRPQPEQQKGRQIVESIKLEARSVLGEMATAALKAAARRYARKL